MIKKFGVLCKKYSIFLLFFLLLVICGFWSKNFFQLGNILNLLRQQSFLVIISMGMLFAILSGGIDLSVGSLIAVSSISTVALFNNGLPLVLVFFCVLGIGIMGGLVTGLLVEKGKIVPFIATLATMSIYRGIAYMLSHGHPVFIKSAIVDLKTFESLGAGKYFGIPIPIIISFFIVLFVHFILNYTTFGRLIFAVGGNREASSFSGIKSSRYIISVYAISGFFTALAGILYASRLGMAHPTLGEGFELDAIAAVILGGASFTGGKGNAFPTLIGALILGLIRNILNLLNVATYPQLIIKGIIIIGAVLINRATLGEDK